MKVNLSTPQKLLAVDTQIILGNTEGQFCQIDKVIYELLRKCHKNSGKSLTVKSYDFINLENPTKIIVGTLEALNTEEVRLLAGKTRKLSESVDAQNVSVNLINYCWKISCKKFIAAFIEGFMLAGYVYDKYLTTKKSCSVKELTIVVPENMRDSLKNQVNESLLLAKWTCAARDLVNEPSNYQTPAKLAEQARNLTKQREIVYEAFDEHYLASLGMEAVLAVSKASPNPPRLIVMRYRGNPESDEVFGLIGKGVTYDSGGLSLKSKQRLYHMKHDMAGAAAVISALGAIAELRIPINVTVVVAACENFLSGNGYKPGDIIGSMAGKSIQIISTDAEGRLTLADAITYAVQYEKVTRILDIATLTGGARRIFGGLINPVLCTDESFFAALINATEYSGERFHLMPMLQEARDLLDCNVADMQNSTTTEYMKMIVGGMFIYEFVKDFDIPWLHIDIAGSGFTTNDSEYIPAGGTGRGVRSIFYLAKKLSDLN